MATRKDELIQSLRRRFEDYRRQGMTRGQAYDRMMEETVKVGDVFSFETLVRYVDSGKYVNLPKKQTAE